MTSNLLSGRRPVLGPAVKQAVPIALDAAVYEGAWVYGTDGRMYASNGTEWKSTVEVAEEDLSVCVKI